MIKYLYALLILLGFITGHWTFIAAFIFIWCCRYSYKHRHQFASMLGK